LLLPLCKKLVSLNFFENQRIAGGDNSPGKETTPGKKVDKLLLEKNKIISV